jgi:hypothetical protein
VSPPWDGPPHNRWPAQIIETKDARIYVTQLPKHMVLEVHRAPRDGQPGSVRFVELEDAEALEVARALAELAVRTK